MERSQSKSLCCGAGGGYAWMDDDPKTRINHLRLADVKECGAKTAAVSCPFCMQMFDDALKTLDPERSRLFKVEPSAFALDGLKEQEIKVSISPAAVERLTAPIHAMAELVSKGSAKEPTLFRVPIDAMFGTPPVAPAYVVWNDDTADVNLTADPVLRSITNQGPVPAVFVATMGPEWVSVESLDGEAWDRPLAPYETRHVRILVNRGRRRGEYGTEVAAIALHTLGSTRVEALSVFDDGPRLPLSFPVRPAVGTRKSRFLYASMPNALAAGGEGRITSDLWLSNLNTSAESDVTLFFTPIPGSGAGAEPRRADIKMKPGATLRFRNLVGNVPGFDGSCSLEVSSSQPTISSTAVITNGPVTPATKASRSRNSNSADAPQASPGGSFGFEMRPTFPGDGVKRTDKVFYLTGLAHETGSQQTNLLLTETSGFDTEVEISLFDRIGGKLVVNGKPVVFRKTVPANSTIQVNDGEIFADDSNAKYYWARIEIPDATTGVPGQLLGSVVPFATVVDSRTDDVTLRVGVSAEKLKPAPFSASGPLVLPRSSPPAPGVKPAGLRAVARAQDVESADGLGFDLELAAANGEADSPPAAKASKDGGRTLSPNLLPVSPVPVMPFGGEAASIFMPVVHVDEGTLPTGEPRRWRTRVTFTNTTRSDDERRLSIKFVDQDGHVMTTRLFVPPRYTMSGFPKDADILEFLFDIPPEAQVYGYLQIDCVKNRDGASWDYTWEEVDIQTETYISIGPGKGDLKTGIEGLSYLHAYSSFQSNLGTVEIGGAENSPRVMTGLRLQEVGGAPCTLAVAAYVPGSFAPIKTAIVTLDRFGFLSKDLFTEVLGLNRTDLTDVRVVVRQIDGEGVFMAFVSKVKRDTRDPDYIFLRPSTAGTGR